MRDLLSEMTTYLDQGLHCVYCAVVETKGSTPQKAGAAMLVFPDGRQSGTLGGGCVEAEVKQRALGLLSGDGGPAIATFSLDDDYGWDDGLICGGRMSMLIDPVGPNRGLPGYYVAYRKLVDGGEGCTEAVVISPGTGSPIGSRYLFDASGQLAAQTGQGAPPEQVLRHLVPLSNRPRPSTHGGVSFLPVLPRITLLIVGGGHVGQAVGRLAAEADFDVWVLDDRERYANRERFPLAKEILVGEIGPTLTQLVNTRITSSTYCIIVTRGHQHDEEALYRLASSKADYVGMIGSKRKIRLIYEDLIAKGVPPAALDQVHAPLGFDIGSQTVPEIAVSIVAELIARRNLGTTQLPLRVRVRAENLQP